EPPPVLIPAIPDAAPIPLAPPAEPISDEPLEQWLAAVPDPRPAAPPEPVPFPATPATDHPLSPGDLLAEIRVLADAG
ncbi:hypothetical protein J0687_27720, partial [Vibrio alginolyticus]|nr:hypothetical protein [Vibrio alginolyticus]